MRALSKKVGNFSAPFFARYTIKSNGAKCQLLIPKARCYKKVYNSTVPRVVLGADEVDHANEIKFRKGGSLFTRHP